ncbi:low molecular weight protein arginine phosphatase [Desulfofalx alkaliphila]|uniref:low molecular weight protein arginine phosphatase n=1 Tax=Desulfofalx alkaliphila TaxID=105483 RepID=UPI0004E0B4C4|nr:low molecular weight protein arginine phosphatase [Desulfofalx alkaliphila]
MKILFVCTGNTCRSTMAEGLAKALAEEKYGHMDIEISSAGTCAISGGPATKEAVEALKEKGIDISRHSSTVITPELIKEADLVLTMTLGHRQQVLQMVPEAEEKTHTLGEYAGIPGDILDPYGQALPIYQSCAGQLEQLIAMAFNRMIKDAGKSKNM